MVATTERCHLADHPLLPELGLLVLVPLEEDAQGLEFEDGFAPHLCFDVGKRLHLNSRHTGQPKLANDRAGRRCVDEQREHLRANQIVSTCQGIRGASCARVACGSVYRCRGHVDDDAHSVVLVGALELGHFGLHNKSQREANGATQPSPSRHASSLYGQAVAQPLQQREENNDDNAANDDCEDVEKHGPAEVLEDVQVQRGTLSVSQFSVPAPRVVPRTPQVAPDGTRRIIETVALQAVGLGVHRRNELGADHQASQLEEHRVVRPLERMPRAAQQTRVCQHWPEGRREHAAHAHDRHHAARLDHSFGNVETRVGPEHGQNRLRDAVGVVKIAGKRAKPDTPDLPKRRRTMAGFTRRPKEKRPQENRESGARLCGERAASGRGLPGAHQAEANTDDWAHEAQDEDLGGNIKVGGLEVQIEEDLRGTRDGRAGVGVRAVQRGAGLWCAWVVERGGGVRLDEERWEGVCVRGGGVGVWGGGL